MNVVMTVLVVVCNFLLMLWFAFVLVGAYLKHKCLGVKSEDRDDSNGKTGVNDEMKWNANQFESLPDIRKVELVQHHDGPDDENTSDGWAISKESEQNVSVTELFNESMVKNHSLPVGWQIFETEDGAVYYCRPDGKTTWEAPW